MHALKAVYIIWYRELLRYWRDKSRIISSLGLPILFLFVFGSGLSPAMGGLVSGMPALPPGMKIDFVKFVFPGVMGMSLVMSSMMAGISVVWDREFGFLKEIMVAPVPRTAIAVGKTLGGGTVGVIQGLLTLIFAPLIGVAVTPLMLAQLIPVMFLIAFSITSLGVAVAVRMKSMEGFQMVMQFVMMPMIFVSGALFPMRNLPAWMDFLVKINPVTYAIDPLRQIIFRAQGLPDMVLQMLPQMGLGVTVFGHGITLLEDVLIIAGFAVLMISLAAILFNIQD